MKENHPIKDDKTFYNCSDVCFDVNSGYHCLWNSSKETDLTKFGIGIVLYFKFLKNLIFFFSIFTVISLFIISIHYNSN